MKQLPDLGIVLVGFAKIPVGNQGFLGISLRKFFSRQILNNNRLNENHFAISFRICIVHFGVVE